MAMTPEQAKAIMAQVGVLEAQLTLALTEVNFAACGDINAKLQSLAPMKFAAAAVVRWLEAASTSEEEEDPWNLSSQEEEGGGGGSLCSNSWYANRRGKQRPCVQRRVHSSSFGTRSGSGRPACTGASEYHGLACDECCGTGGPDSVTHGFLCAPLSHVSPLLYCA